MLSPDHHDALTEIINVGVGKAAEVLNSMMESHIRLSVPSVTVVNRESLRGQLESDNVDAKISAIRLGFNGPFSGTAALVFPVDSASNLVRSLTGDETGDDDMDSLRVGTLTEIGNIVMNGVMGSIGNMLSERLDYAVPNYLEDTPANLVSVAGAQSQDTALLAEARFVIEELQVDGGIVLFFEVGSFDALLRAIDVLVDDLANG